MKIAFLSTFYPFRGGIAQFNALVYRSFEKKANIKAYTFKRQYPEFLFPGKTQYVTEQDSADPIPAERVLDTINPFTYWTAARKIRKYEPNLMLVKYWMTFFAPGLGFVASRLKNTVKMAVLDNVIPHEKRFFDGMLNRYFLKRYDGFIVMSDKVLHDLLSLKPEAKYLRINHPVYNHFGATLDAETAKKQLGVPENKKILLFFGIIRDYKGLNLLIEALSHLDDSYHLLIAGEVYGSFEKYEQQIKQLNLSEKISLHNHYIGDNEVNKYFSAADVCVLPYISATQSGITSIANHFLLPLIATDVGGLKETISDGETGLMVSEVNSSAIAKVIRRYFSENLKEKFAAKIAEHNRENSWDNFTDKILHFYEEIKNKP